MNSSHFYETISHRSDHPIRISTEFMKRHGESLRGSVILSSGGNEWRVGLKNINDGTWFDKGWKRFLGFYSVEEDYLLMFEYKGDSRFLVFIFDKSANEIVYPDIVPVEESESESESDNSPGKHNLAMTVVNGRRLRKRIPASRDSDGSCVRKRISGRDSDGSCVRKRISGRDSDGSCVRKRISGRDSDGSCEEMSVVKDRRVRKRISDRSCEGRLVLKGRGQRKRISGKDSDGKCDGISLVKNRRMWKRISGKDTDGRCEEIPKALPPPQSEENKLTVCVREFKSENPFFVFLTKPYQVSKNYEAGVPNKFWTSYFPAKDICGQGLKFGLRLVNQKKKWPIVMKNCRGVGMFRGTGWRDFAKEVGLIPGEVCIFELVKEEEVFDVHRY